MKRSQINSIMRRCAAFLSDMRFYLPPFAWWTPDMWRQRGDECSDIVRHQLGWDITDFGSGDFDHIGLFLFTLRNGSLSEVAHGGKPYAEKILIAEEGQVTPPHFHHQKMEDIIVRGGGALAMQLWNATEGDELATSDVRASVDGEWITLPAGGTLVLSRGQSICLPPRQYHKFWGRQGTGTVLVGEVSSVNDDATDNRFLDAGGRFPALEEDAPPLHLLVTDYRRYYRFA